MAAVTADEVVVNVRADLGDYEATMTRAGKAFDTSMERIEKGAGDTEKAVTRSFAAIGAKAGLLAGAGVAALGAALGGLALSAVKYVGELKKTADGLGITTQAFQQFEYAAKSTGVSQEEMEKGLKSLTDQIGKAALGSDKPSKIFQTLGINIRDASGKVRDAAEIFPELADRLNAIPDPAERAATAALIFGGNAAALRPLLDQGSLGINTLRDAAQRLGIVLSEKQIQEADRLAKKLDDLRLVISADITAAVVNNADAILTLAGAFLKLTENVLGTITALTNYRAISKLYSPASTAEQRGAAAQTLLGSKSGRDALLAHIDERIAQNSADRSAGRGGRTSYLGGLVEVTRKASAEDNAALDREFKGLIRQRNAVLKAARVDEKRDAAVPAKGAPIVTGLLAPPPRKGPKDRSAQNEARFENALERLQAEYLAALADTTGAAQDRLAAERAQVEAQRLTFNRSTDADDRLSNAKKTELKLANDRVAAQEQAALTAREERRLDSLRLEALADDRRALSAEADLVTVRTARHDVERRILDILEQEEKQRLETAIAAGDVLDETKARAALARQQSARRTGVDRQFESPLEKYRREIVDVGNGINDQLEQVQVDGLKGLTDGIADAITGAKSLGDVFKNVANQIIADLVRIAVQQAIVGPLLGVGGGGIFSAIGSFFGGGRASGGPVGAGQTYLVGERGPELLHMGANAGVVVPNHALRQGGQGGGTVVQQHFDLRGAVVTKDLYARMTAIADSRAVMAAQVGAKLGSADAQRNLMRPRLPASAG